MIMDAQVKVSDKAWNAATTYKPWWEDYTSDLSLLFTFLRYF